MLRCVCLVCSQCTGLYVRSKGHLVVYYKCTQICVYFCNNTIQCTDYADMKWRKRKRTALRVCVGLYISKCAYTHAEVKQNMDTNIYVLWAQKRLTHTRKTSLDFVAS